MKFKIFIILSIFIFGFTCCFSDREDKISSVYTFKSYRDVPGVTNEDFAKIEVLKLQYDSFVYGVNPTTEAFLNEDGEIKGYAPILCEWLSDLFGIKFIPKQVLFTELLDGLESGYIDFTGDLTPSDERRKSYYMTSGIVHRWLCYYRLEGSESLFEISKRRLPRYALLSRSTIKDDVLHYSNELFEPFLIDEYDEAYSLLKEGVIDAFIMENISEAYFDNFDDIVMENYFPLIDSPVSLTTQKEELEPIINIVQKVIDNGGYHFFSELYDKGYNEYRKHKLFSKLSNEEKEYLKLNPVIKYAAEYDNYPSSFYNTRVHEWQGVVFDVLEEVEALTGFKFELANDEKTDWHELLEMLENGEVLFVGELLWTPDREGRFLWPKASIFNDRPALISLTDIENININKVPSVLVGLPRGTAHAELFLRWFPNNHSIIILDSQDAAYNALLNKETDMIMGSYSNMLYLTNYLERADVKPNIIFDHIYESTFGFHKDAVLLCSIFDKALELIDTGTLSNQWTNRTYDYRVKVAEALFPWLIGSTVMASVIVALIIFIVYTNKLKIKHAKEERELTKAFVKAEEHIMLMLDSSPLACLLWDEKGNFIDCNESAVRIFGYENKQELVKRWISECIPEYQPDGSSSYEAGSLYHKKAIEKGKCSFTWMHLTSDGSQLPTEIELIRTQSKNGIILVQYMKDLRDIQKVTSELEKRDNLLKAVNCAASVLLEAEGSENFKNSLIRGLEIIGNCVDADSVEIWKNEMVNNLAHAVLKYYWYNDFASRTKERIINELPYSLTPNWYERFSRGEIIVGSIDELSQEDRNFFKYYKSESTFIIPIIIQNQFWGICSIDNLQKKHLFSDDEIDIIRSGILMVINAINRHAQAAAIKEALHKANEASRVKTEFLAKMSHEIRTPMNAIIGMTEIALRENEADAKNEHINTVKQASGNLLAIINDILDFSKIEAGKLEIFPEEYSVTSLINDLISIIRTRVVKSKMRFAVKVDSKLPSVLFGDETKIRQAVLNILNNAVKYTENGFVLFSIFGEYVNNDTVKVIFEVTDSGIGIKQEDLGKLFTDFTQLDLERNRGVEGIGLGLAITKSIVDAMDGFIKVKSEYGQGSTFTITIPQKFHSREVIAKVESPEKKKTLILIYERRDINADSLNYTLKNLGVECTIVTRGTDLYEEMEQKSYNYLFIPYVLYKKNEDTISKFGSNTKVVILSSLGEIIYEKGFEVLTMPVYCTQIANIFNGISVNASDNNESESIVKFTAEEARILIVDDINTNLKVAEGLLAPYKMNVDLCNSGEAALNAVKKEKYDLVFMDHKMPGMDGVEVTKRIREWDKNIPIIALTANAVVGMQEMFIENGFSDFLSKPIDTGKLNAILEKWVPKEKQKSVNI